MVNLLKLKVGDALSASVNKIVRQSASSLLSLLHRKLTVDVC